jgi:hypothetical protein
MKMFETIFTYGETFPADEIARLRGEVKGKDEGKGAQARKGLESA